MTTREPMKVIADIIQHELVLLDRQVVLYNQKYNLPTSDDILVVVSLMGMKLLGVKTELGSAATEEQSISMLLQIQIDIMSADSSARLRFPEIVMALNSFYAQQQCDTYNMKIARFPSSIADASAVEETAILNRYAFTIRVNAVYSKSKVQNDWFDSTTGPDIWSDIKPT